MRLDEWRAATGVGGFVSACSSTGYEVTNITRHDLPLNRTSRVSPKMTA